MSPSPLHRGCTPLIDWLGGIGSMGALVLLSGCEGSSTPVAVAPQPAPPVALVRDPSLSTLPFLEDLALGTGRQLGSEVGRSVVGP